MKPNFQQLLQTHLGFDSLFNELESFIEQGSTVPSYPPYNIIKENHGYVIELALAGFKKSEISVSHDKRSRKLVISGAKSTDPNSQVSEKIFLAKRIANRSFSATFKVADNMEISSAKMEDGILTIKLDEVKCEEDKPIAISIM